MISVFNNVMAVASGHHIWNDMANTVEASPWHREANVAVHTIMVIDEYFKLMKDDNIVEMSIDDCLGALACLFHDFGKPSSLVVKYKPERGNYNSFNGHEVVSARLWEDFAVTNWHKLFKPFGFTAQEISAVSVLVEHHLPYDTIDKTKRRNLAKTVNLYFNNTSIFTRVLLADTRGRISDDHQTKKAKVDVWCQEFNLLIDDVKEEQQNEFRT